MKNVKSITLNVLCLIAVCASSCLYAQETASIATVQTTIISEKETEKKTKKAELYTVKGTVKDQDDLPLVDVNVVLKGTNEGIVTDFDGTFEWPRQLAAGDVLVFSYIGFNPQEYEIQESDSEIIDIAITFDLSNISLMGAVEVEGVYSSKRSFFQKFLSLFN